MATEHRPLMVVGVCLLHRPTFLVLFVLCFVLIVFVGAVRVGPGLLGLCCRGIKAATTSRLAVARAFRLGQNNAGGAVGTRCATHGGHHTIQFSARCDFIHGRQSLQTELGERRRSQRRRVCHCGGRDECRRENAEMETLEQTHTGSAIVLLRDANGN